MVSRQSILIIYLLLMLLMCLVQLQLLLLQLLLLLLMLMLLLLRLQILHFQLLIPIHLAILLRQNDLLRALSRLVRRCHISLGGIQLERDEALLPIVLLGGRRAGQWLKFFYFGRHFLLRHWHADVTGLHLNYTTGLLLLTIDELERTLI